MLKSIDCSDIEIEHIIVVPDRFSLQAEKLVFELAEFIEKQGFRDFNDLKEELRR